MRSTHAPPHLRHDPLTARTVIVAEARADRPNELAGATIACPFCAGHESLTPPDVLRSPAASGGWTARIVPNQFPITQCPVARCAVDRDAPRTAADRRAARGVHDVVIESPTHARSILEVDPAGWCDAWHLCRRRLADLAARGDLAWGMVFKNSGAAAGASLEHVHSQLVALDFVPDGFAAELAAAGRAVDPFGDLLLAADREERIVETSGDLVALVPAAPRQPFETWILPRTAEPHFHATSTARVESLAALTRSLVGRLETLVPGGAYNWWLHQYPYASSSRAAADAHPAQVAAWHWHLEIMPRINGLAGFELGTGCHITTMSATAAAQRLRSG